MYALLAYEEKEKDDFDQSEFNFYISFLTSDDTNTIPPSFNPISQGVSISLPPRGGASDTPPWKSRKELL